MDWHNVAIPHGEDGDDGQIQPHPEPGVLEEHVPEGPAEDQQKKNRGYGDNLSYAFHEIPESTFIGSRHHSIYKHGNPLLTCRNFNGFIQLPFDKA